MPAGRESAPSATRASVAPVDYRNRDLVPAASRHSRKTAVSPRTLVLIPTYNEKDNIESITQRVLTAAPDVDVLILDDGSPDGTGAVADGLARGDARIQVMHRTSKEGLGAAYLAGFAYAGENGYDVVVEIDADGSHPPEALPRMLTEMSRGVDGGLGGVIGSRWVPGGSVVNWPLLRKIISKGGSWYARTMLGVPVRDVTAGYRVYPVEVLNRLSLDELESRGYCFQIDMTRRVIDAGYRLTEVPIVFRERERGQSKMSQAIVVEAMWRVTLWGWQRLRGRVVGEAPQRR